MNNASEIIALLQARARLRELLPILPNDEEGTRPFSYPSLEGFLYALHVSPIEIDMDTWGYFLDQRLPDPCYESDSYRDDIITLYEDMAFALEDNLYFKVHTLSIPRSIPVDEIENHPLEHWMLGFLSGMLLVLSELKPRSKQLRKSKAYQKMRKNYETAVSVLTVLLHRHIRSNMSPLEENTQKFQEKLDLVNKPLDEVFLFVLEHLHGSGLIASDRLEEIL